MKIALVFFELKAGGGAIQCLQLANWLQKRGHKVKLFCWQNQLSPQLDSLTKTIPIIQVGKRASEPVRFGMLRKIFLLANAMKLESFDLINPHEWPAVLAASLVKMRKNTKVVWMCNDLWYVPNEEFYNQSNLSFLRFKRQLRWYIDRYLTRKVDKIVVLDNRIKSLIRKYYKREAIVVRSGVDIHKFKNAPGKNEARKKLKLPHDSFIFLCFGVFYSHRRYEDVLKAVKELTMEKLPSFKVVIAGDNRFSADYYRKLTDLANNLSVFNHMIIRSGFFSFEETVCYYASCDAFIFPNYRQTWGIAPIEAMCLGKVCIVSRGAGVHEVLKDSDTALLFNPGDIASLAERMKLVLKNETLRIKIGHKAQDFVLRNFSWEKYGQNMEKIFKY